MDATMWASIYGFVGKYEVSNEGLVRNAQTLRVLKPKTAGAGYQQVCLGAGNYRYVHRLVAQTFIENPLGLPQVNHLDGDKKNNSDSNLSWCSARENSMHAYNSGLLDGTICKNPQRGGFHYRARPVVMLSDSGHIQVTYHTISSAANETGIDYSTIHGALHGKFKQAGGWRWQFAN
jgi:hypothetical protein